MDMKTAGALNAYAYQSALALAGNTTPASGRGPTASQARASGPRAPVQVATTPTEPTPPTAGLDLLA